MYYVYLLRLDRFPVQAYTGLSSDLKARLKKHNEGGSPHTSKYKPLASVVLGLTSWNDRAVAFSFKCHSQFLAKYFFSNLPELPLLASDQK